MSIASYPYGYAYETVAVSQTGQVLGGAGAKGDILQRIIVNVITAATATLTIIDGATSIVVATGGATVVPGSYSLEFGLASQSGAWSVTTGAGCTALCVGIFTA